MNKDKFKQELDSLQDQQELILNKISELKANYINENSLFEIGEKVIVSSLGNKRYAFIKKRYIGYNNEIKYDLFKCKNDGSPSKVNDYVFYFEKIEKIS